MTLKKEQLVREKREASVAAAQEAEAKALSDLAGRLEQFYETWGAARSEAEIKALALKYLSLPDMLDVKLRERYDGTDLSTSFRDIIKARSDREEAQSRQEREKALIETAALDSTLRNFYAAWDVTRADTDIQRLASEFVGKEDELNKLLQKRYFGSDMTWSHDTIQHKRREVNVDRLEQSLRAFYARWHEAGVGGKNRKEILAAAEEFVGREAELNEMLRDTCHGTDLTWTNDAIAAKVDDVRAEMRIREAAKKQADWEIAALDERHSAEQAQEAPQQVPFPLTSACRTLHYLHV